MFHPRGLGNLVSAGMKKRVGAEPKPAPQIRIDGTIKSSRSILFFCPILSHGWARARAEEAEEPPIRKQSAFIFAPSGDD
jgi:hypothetical protein